MEIWQAIVLGAVQGFTEFLPVSSSGHLLLVQRWFGISENVTFYSVMLHLGTLVPVTIVLRREIVSLFKKPFNKLINLIIATVPAGVAGLLLGVFVDIDAVFSERIWLLALSFLITAAALFFAETRGKKQQIHNPINRKTSFIMGLGQSVGVICGISRSGATITASVVAKADREEAANFTFLMSIPVILAAVGLATVKTLREGSLGGAEFLPVAFGVLSASVTGYIAISFMLKLIKKANYKWFGLYLVLLSFAVMLSFVFGI